MNTVKQNVMRLVRQAGTVGIADKARMSLAIVRTFRSRARFRRENPSFPIPPINISYDAFGALDPYGYREMGIHHADLLSEMIKRHAPSAHVVCDWGCGPVRVLRHMPKMMPSVNFIGLDYNEQTIKWCRANIPGIKFETSGSQPPIPLKDSSVDVLYCLSVFTHLSEEMHHAFSADILRVLRPGGLLIATSHGNRYRNRLLPEELAAFDSGKLVCRDWFSEGKKMFVAFHPPAFMKEALRRFEILEHDQATNTDGFEQDYWIARAPF